MTVSNSRLLNLDNAEWRYQGGIALRNINFSLHPGERIALVGRSGSGKSSLLRLIYQHLPNETALVPQDEGLVETLSVYHNVYMGRLANHPAWYNLINLARPFQARIQEVEAILQGLQLQDKCFVPVAQLSGGQRQRTAVARSLYQGGQLLLADEPVSAVDEKQSRHILSTLNQHFPTTVVALHDTALALAYCDRIIGLDSGTIVLDAPASSLDAKQLSELYSDDASLR